MAEVNGKARVLLQSFHKRPDLFCRECINGLALAADEVNMAL